MSFVFKFSPGKTHVFIHIPKNGGTSLWKNLEQYNPYAHTRRHRPDDRFVGHLSYLQTKQLFPPGERLNFFCITRNPWERMVSYFHYIKQVSHKKHGSKLLHKLLKKGMGFDDFLEHTINGDQCRFKPQIAYMVDEQGSVAIDDILRLERIQSDLNDLLSKNGCPSLPAEKQNASDHKPYTEYYKTESSVQLVEDYERDVIDQYGYRFGA